MSRSEALASNEHEAINRLFDLARDGQTGSREFKQLESIVYDRFIHSYDNVRVDPLGQVQVMPSVAMPVEQAA